MSEQMSEIEKIKSNEIVKNFRQEGVDYSPLIQDFMKKFNKGEISIGGKVITLDEVEEWCNDSTW